MDPKAVRLKTLGSFAIIDPPTLAATKLGLKERALIAFLAYKLDRDVYRDDVSRLLWANVDERRGKHSLSQALSSLNKALPGWLLTTGATIKLTIPKSSIDLHQVHTLLAEGNITDACGLLCGRFLADVTIDLEEFADWKDAVNFDFYRDVETKSLSLLANKSVRSIQERHGLTRRLRSVIPLSDSLRDLDQALSNQLQKEELHKDGPSLTADADKPGPLTFVGRIEEFTTLRNQFNRSLEGSGQFILLEGSAGVGKTRLLAEFTRAAVSMARVISIRCYEPERHIGLNGVTDLIQGLVDASTFERLPPVFAAALADVVGIDNSILLPLPELSTLGSQRRLFEAVLRVLDFQLKKAPLVIVFDDLQWADQSTLAFLHLLARRIQTRAVMVVAASRPTPRVNKFAKSDVVGRLSLRDFSAAEIESLKNDPQLTAACRESSTKHLLKLTAGNAFLLTEYLRSYNDNSGLSGVRRMLSSHSTRDFIRALVSGLSPASIRLISALAVLGRPRSQETVQQIVGQSLESFSKSTQQLVSRRILNADTTLSFRHDLIREGVYRRIPATRRRLLHRRAGQLLKANESHGAVARHFYLAGDNETAHQFAIMAVEGADARLALNEAAHFVRLAIKTAPNRLVRAKLHKDLAERSFRLRRYRKASHHIHAALEQGVPLKRADKAALTLLELDMLVTIGRISTHDLVAHITEFEQTYSGVMDRELRYGVLRLLIRSSAIEGDAIECARYSKRLVEFAGASEGILSARALSLAARTHSYSTSYVEALPWAERAERLIEAESNPEAAAEILTDVGSVYVEAGKYRRALQLYDLALGYVHASGALNLWPRTATHKHMLLVEMGMFEEARALGNEIAGAWNEDDARQHISTLEGNTALMHFHLHDYERTLHHARNSLSNAQESGLYSTRLTATALIGLAELESGRLSEANKHASDLAQQIGYTPKRLGDYSYVEMFFARWNVRHGRQQDALKSLRIALKDCALRDVGSYLRMKLEYASVLRRTNPNLAATVVREVKAVAETVGAAPTVEQSAMLLARCQRA